MDKKESREKLLEGLKTICQQLRQVDVDFIVCLNPDDGDEHNVSVDLNVRNDHHFLDMLTSITGSWWKCHHKK